ncbi:hypothetical protein HBA54_19415 [Pelagibius litoralis]|uniref:Uncharacterized protein n=1 Tax=Pelagibius litoralis TaxID=374515 RepID=A0A967F0A5_9PROT|nr:hypothetical protein [Pelagibius litoralis]NIA70773.1 hypothetical protein [Pelagibius litoralis]
MQLSLTPILLAAELGFLFALAWRCLQAAPQPGSTAAVHAHLIWIAGYAILTSLMGARGMFIADDLMPWLPGLWLQVITVAVCVGPVVLFAPLRYGLRSVFDATPWRWLAYFHGLRILALGTLYKTQSGEFPGYFAYLVGVPDLLFGLSAFWIAVRARRGDLTAQGFMIWNLIGALIIVPSAPILLQLGLPGPLQVFTSQPDARAVFTYPMSIAPIIGVPLFVLVNLWAAWRLWERRNAKARSLSR